MKPFSFEGESERERGDREDREGRGQQGQAGIGGPGGVKVLEQGGSKSETFTGENSKFGPCKQKRRVHIVIMHLEWKKRRWSQVDA